MDTPAFRAAIRAAVRACLGWTATDDETETRVQWEDDGLAYAWRSVPYVDLLETSETSVGVDETLYSYDELEDQIDGLQSGLREVTIQVKAVSDDSCGDLSSATLIRNLRLRLRRPSILAILQAANIAVVRFQPTARATFFQDNRDMDARILDVVFSTSDTDVRDPAGGDYFDRAEIENLVTPEGET